MKREIKVSEVISLLDAGKSREEIGQHFELSNADLTALFKHPSLKGKKAKKQRNFVVVDDTTTNEEVAQIADDIAVEDIQEEVATQEEVANTPWEN